MQISQSLPDHYRLIRQIDLSKDTRLLWILNLAGLPLLAIACLLFGWLASAAQPDVTRWQHIDFTLMGLVWILVGFALTLVLHELVHGIMFWILTRDRPKFGLRLSYAYAAAPQWYIPRNPYLLVGLAPLVILSVIGVLVLPLLPASLLPAWLFAMLANTSGAIGDLYIVGWLLTRSSLLVVNDRGDAMNIFAPSAGSEPSPD